jgi:AcrR family transcriptional regulator
MSQPVSDTATERRWRRLPGERPQQILEAALEIFGQQGLAKARLEDIAQRAGVSKGTIYLYFPNKEALFREVIRSYVARHIESFARQSLTGSGEAQIKAFSREYWAYLRSPIFAVVYHLLHAERHQFPDLAEFYLHEVLEPAIGLISDIHRRGVAQGEFRPLDPIVATRMLVSLFVMHSNWCGQRDFVGAIKGRTDEQVFDETLDFFLTGIRATPDDMGAIPTTS